MASMRVDERVFVGRTDELKRFGEVLASPRGLAVIVVGQAGMGKTMLVNRMANCARDHPNLKCGAVRYEVTPAEPVGNSMALMIDHAFEAAQVVERSLEQTERRHTQWRALLNVIKIGDLVMSLKRDPQRNSRDQFIERLNLISRRLPENGRAVFIIDPEKYMQPGSQDDWRLVVRELPEKIKFLFPQRPEDVLISSRDFLALDNVIRIPDDRLEVLDERAVEDLLDIRAPDLKAPIGQVREAVGRYGGHPYAVPAALDLIADGRPFENLPADPTPERIAETQWNQVCDRHGEKAIKLFQAYALLEVPVPDEVVEAVSGLKSDGRRALLANPYLAGLLRAEQHGRRIYHSLLSDHVCAQLSEEESSAYHRRAVDIYRDRLKAETKPDALAAVRLSEHVLAAEGPGAFLHTFAGECMEPLLNLGLLDTALSLSRRALEKFVSPGTAEEATIRGNLGLIYRTRGDLDKAEQMHRKSLAIEEKLGRLEGMASDYGNLGLIYQTRGDLDTAEEMFRKVLEIEQKLGRLDSIASAYGNLGVIYQTRGDLEKAEDMLRKSLAINEKLGRLEGIASNYGNLGLIYRNHGDLEKAEDMLRKSLAINEKLGRVEGMAKQYGNLGGIYGTRGDLDKAEEMLRKSLAIEEKLGRLEGMASDYGNLGLIYRTRGNLRKARELWAKARDLYTKIGMPHMVARVQELIDDLPSP